MMPHSVNFTLRIDRRVLLVQNLIRAGPESTGPFRFKDGAPRGDVQRGARGVRAAAIEIPHPAFRWGPNSSPEGLSKGFTTLVIRRGHARRVPTSPRATRPWLVRAR